MTAPVVFSPLRSIIAALLSSPRWDDADRAELLAIDARAEDLCATYELQGDSGGEPALLTAMVRAAERLAQRVECVLTKNQ